MLRAPEDARLEIAALLEPAICDAVAGTIEADISSHQLERLAIFSQAVSLRRIADALSSPDGLNEVLTSAVGNLASTLAEHRMYSK